MDDVSQELDKLNDLDLGILSALRRETLDPVTEVVKPEPATGREDLGASGFGFLDPLLKYHHSSAGAFIR